MVEYTKPWLSVDGQVERLVEHGLDVGDRNRARSVLEAVGYYRLSGYLYPFRESEFPASDWLTIESLGAPKEWQTLELWRGSAAESGRDTADR